MINQRATGTIQLMLTMKASFEKKQKDREKELQALREANLYPWTLREGHELLVTPIVKCPYCLGPIKVFLIFLLHREGRTVRFAWSSKTGVKVRLGTCHPHVGGNGYVCMGDHTDTVAALTNGLNPNSEYHSVRYWLEQWGEPHTCLGRHRPPQVDFEVDEPELVTCHECSSSIEIDGDDCYFCEPEDVYYCTACWPDNHQLCQDCHTDICYQDESMDSVPTVYSTGALFEIPLCGYCFSTRQGAGRVVECSRCHSTWDLDSIRYLETANGSEPICAPCYNALQEGSEENPVPF